jgi:predicted PurR-regulated permease PerM
MIEGPRETSALRWTTVALAAAAVYVCWPLWPAIVLAAWTAVLAAPMLAYFERGREGRRHAAAALSLILFIVVLLPVVLIALGVVSGARDLAATIAASPSAKEALENILAGSDSTATTHLPRTLPEVADLARQYGSQGFGVLSKIAGAATAVIIGLFIYFVGTFVFLVDGPAFGRWMERNSPLAPAHFRRMAAAFHETGRGLIVGIGLTALTQGVMATITYAALGIPRWWVLGAATGIAAILPLVGSALVWAPLALGLLLTGHPVKALILVVIGAGVISTVDNVLRPIYARMGSLRMPMLGLLVSIFGGVAVAGGWGVILGPLVVRMFMEALALRREQADQLAANALPSDIAKAPPAPN